MSKAELVAQQLAAAANLSRIWSGLLYNVLDEGLVGGGVTDDTVKLQALVNKAITEGRKLIYFPHGENGQYRVTALANADQVVFLGDNASFVGGYAGTIEQLGGLGPQIIQVNKAIPPTSKTAALYERAIAEMRNTTKDALFTARQAISKGTLNVVFMGDSITEASLASDNQIDKRDGYVERVTNELRRTLKGITINAFNYGLGGRKISQAADANYLAVNPEPADKSGFWRDWSTAGKSWRDHVRDAAPDLLVIAFGMNDSKIASSDYNQYINLKALIDYSQTWTKRPSIVVVPTILPTTDTTLYNQTQERTIATARASRLYAIERGVVLADVNRLYRILRDGVDDAARQTDRSALWEGWTEGKWEGSQYFDHTEGETSIRVKTSSPNGKSVVGTRSFFNGFHEVDIYPKADGDAGVGWIQYRYHATYGRIILLVKAGSGTGSLALYYNPGKDNSGNDQGNAKFAEQTGLTIPSSAWSTIRMEADGTNHKVYLNGTLVLNASTYYCLHDGPVKMGTETGSAVTPDFRNSIIGYQDPLRGNPLYTEAELLGVSGSDDSGNAINHPTGEGHALYYLPAFYGVIDNLHTQENLTAFLPTKITGSTFKLSSSYPQQNNAGEWLFYAAVSKLPDNRHRSVALRRLDTGAYYTLAPTSVNGNPAIQGLTSGQFAYFRSTNTADLVWIVMPSNVAPTFDVELWRPESIGT